MKTAVLIIAALALSGCGKAHYEDMQLREGVALYRKAMAMCQGQPNQADCARRVIDMKKASDRDAAIYSAGIQASIRR